MKQIFVSIFMLMFIFSGWTQGSLNYQIDVNVSNYDQDTLILGYYYGDRQLVKDTMFRDDQGGFSFSGTDTLQSGMYLLLIKPSNAFVQFLIPQDDHNFKISMNADDLSDISFEGSEINSQFYQYLDFLSEMRYNSDSLNFQIAHADSLGLDSLLLENESLKLNNSVSEYQSKIIESNPNGLMAQLVKSSFSIDIPDFEGTEEDIRIKKYLYYRDHYFDNIDPSIASNLYMPYLHTRVDYFMNKLTPQHPDSISNAIGGFLNKLDSAPNTFKFYLSHFLNTYGNSRVVGMDAVYIYLMDNYYSQGQAPWVDDITLKKMVSNANRVRPTLIGKIGADLELYKEDGTPIKLSEIDCDYMILMFWAPKCGHCTKAMPYAIEFNEKYKDKGVKFISICTKHQDQYPSCWEAIKEKKMESFLNLGDQFHKSRFKSKYNVDKTPKIFIMDSDRKILIKDVGAQQLDTIMEQLLEKDVLQSGMK